MKSAGTSRLLGLLFIVGAAAVPRVSYALPLPDSAGCGGGTCLQITNTGSGVGLIASGPDAIDARSSSNGNGFTASGGAGGITGTATTGLGVEAWGGLTSTTSAFNKAGVYGEATGNSDGMFAQTSSGVNSGAVGINNNAAGSAVYGNVTASGGGYAIEGESNLSGTAWAGYFRGRVVGMSFITASDARLKRDVAPLRGGMRLLDALRPVNYHWKDAASDMRMQTGLIAQEVNKVLPQIVTEDANTGMLSVNYLSLTPVVVSAINEHGVLLKLQEARLTELEHGDLFASVTSNQWLYAAMLLPLGILGAFRRRREHVLEAASNEKGQTDDT